MQNDDDNANNSICSPRLKRSTGEVLLCLSQLISLRSHDPIFLGILIVIDGRFGTFVHTYNDESFDMNRGTVFWGKAVNEEP